MLSKEKIKELVLKEIKQMNEEVNFEGIKDVVTFATKLLSSVKAFKKVANQTMLSSVTPAIDTIEKSLEDMVQNPSAYTDKKAVEPQVIKLRKVD